MSRIGLPVTDCTCDIIVQLVILRRVNWLCLAAFCAYAAPWNWALIIGECQPLFENTQSVMLPPSWSCSLYPVTIMNVIIHCSRKELDYLPVQPQFDQAYIDLNVRKSRWPHPMINVKVALLCGNCLVKNKGVNFSFQVKSESICFGNGFYFLFSG